MPSDKVVGKVQNFEETTVEWKIADFITMMSRDPGTFYFSPSFAFSDAICYLQIYPNGEEGKSECVGLYLYLDENYDYEIAFKMSLKTRIGKFAHTSKYSKSVFKDPSGHGWEVFCRRSELINEKSELLPGGILTVHCNVRRAEPRLVAIPRLERLKNVCRDLKKLLTENKFTDLIFKFGEREVQAHKMILENRSEYFQKMLSNDMIESRTGTITIDDCDPEVFQQVLSYIYCGEVDELSVGNMCQLYTATDRYQLNDLRKMCVTFMEENISADLFCDVLVVADACNDTRLMQILKEYFAQNSKSVIKTEQWKSFSKENLHIAFELLQTIVEENAEKLKLND